MDGVSTQASSSEHHLEALLLDSSLTLWVKDSVSQACVNPTDFRRKTTYPNYGQTKESVMHVHIRAESAAVSP